MSLGVLGNYIKSLVIDWLIDYLMEWVYKEKKRWDRTLSRQLTVVTDWAVVCFTNMGNTTFRFCWLLFLFLLPSSPHIWAAGRHPRNLNIALSVTQNPWSWLIRGMTWNKLFLRQILWFIAMQDRRLYLVSVLVCSYLRLFMAWIWPRLLHRESAIFW